MKGALFEWDLGGGPALLEKQLRVARVPLRKAKNCAGHGHLGVLAHGQLEAKWHVNPSPRKRDRDARAILRIPPSRMRDRIFFINLFWPCGQAGKGGNELLG
ncbi:MAG: hypothetical protein JWR26_1252 [Pedosphaera sp.]|nr:hypothetical protein [Pedosphaera sp.]